MTIFALRKLVFYLLLVPLIAFLLIGLEWLSIQMDHLLFDNVPAWVMNAGIIIIYLSYLSALSIAIYNKMIGGLNYFQYALLVIEGLILFIGGLYLVAFLSLMFSEFEMPTENL